jgi:hypothetical protein
MQRFVIEEAIAETLGKNNCSSGCFDGTTTATSQIESTHGEEEGEEMRRRDEDEEVLGRLQNKNIQMKGFHLQRRHWILLQHRFYQFIILVIKIRIDTTFSNKQTNKNK